LARFRVSGLDLGTAGRGTRSNAYAVGGRQIDFTEVAGRRAPVFALGLEAARQRPRNVV
jgi:hypothetical protein